MISYSQNRSGAAWSPSCVLSGGLVATSLAVLAAIQPARAHDNDVTISISGDGRCIASNGLPDHSTGRFPNSGNPNRISEQSVNLCVPLNPKRNSQARPIVGSIGFALNGVQIRPGTADYYDASSRRGFSRDRSSGWNLEGLGARDMLGMDQNNAHVDHNGMYHYHGVSPALVGTAESSLIGYAADGFEIHYVGGRQTSSYRLKTGTRPSGPGGAYDGTYVQDWEYVAGLGSLDVCNAGTLNGKFVYFATDSYPFFPRCLWGTASSDFQQGGAREQNARAVGAEVRSTRRAQDASEGGRRDGRLGNRPRRDTARRGPPTEAIDACNNLSNGSACRFEAPGRNRDVSGTCQDTPRGVAACVPAGRRAGLRN